MFFFKKNFHLVSVVRVQDEITISCFAKIRGFPQNTLDQGGENNIGAIMFWKQVGNVHMVLMQTWCVLDVLWCYTIMLNHTSFSSRYTSYFCKDLIILILYKNKKTISFYKYHSKRTTFNIDFNHFLVNVENLYLNILLTGPNCVWLSLRSILS